MLFFYLKIKLILLKVEFFETVVIEYSKYVV